jgi:hypothetical protein
VLFAWLLVFRWKRPKPDYRLRGRNWQEAQTLSTKNRPWMTASGILFKPALTSVDYQCFMLPSSLRHYFTESVLFWIL